MLEADTKLLQNDLVEKLKFCDKAVMDQSVLKYFYDRDTETKL